MRTSGLGKRLGAAAAVVIVGTAIAGCQGGSSGATAATSSKVTGTPASSGTEAAAGRAARPGETATAYPVPASATPEPLPVLGSRSDGLWTLVLNGVRRSGAGSIVVTATLASRSSGDARFSGFEEPGYSLRANSDGKLDSTLEFSAVTLTVPGSTTQYQVLRDTTGHCACTQGLLYVKSEQTLALYAYVTAPAEATAVTITVQGFAPFVGVQVQS